MSTFAPDISHSLSLKDIFNNKIPAVADTEEGDVKATEKHLLSPELIAYLKCLTIVARRVQSWVEAFFFPESDWFSLTGRSEERRVGKGVCQYV